MALSKKRYKLLSLLLDKPLPIKISGRELSEIRRSTPFAIAKCDSNFKNEQSQSLGIHSRRL